MVLVLWLVHNLSAQFAFQLGGKIYDGDYQALMHNGKKAGLAMHKDLLKAWSPEHISGKEAIELVNQHK